MTVTREALTEFLHDAHDSPFVSYADLADKLLARYELTDRAPDPGPPCLDHYAGDMVCSQPAGHPVDVAKPDTWHRYGTVRWC